MSNTPPRLPQKPPRLHSISIDCFFVARGLLLGGHRLGPVRKWKRNSCMVLWAHNGAGLLIAAQREPLQWLPTSIYGVIFFNCSPPKKNKKKKSCSLLLKSDFKYIIAIGHLDGRFWLFKWTAKHFLYFICICICI